MPSKKVPCRDWPCVQKPASALQWPQANSIHRSIFIILAMVRLLSVHTKALNAVRENPQLCHAAPTTLPCLEMKIAARWFLLKCTLVDHLRHSKILRSLNAIRLLVQGSLRSGPCAADALSRALAFSEHVVLSQLVARQLRRRFPPESNADLWTQVVANLPRYRDLLREASHLTRSILLKAPGTGGEKGVLLMYFEYNWVRLALGIPAAEFDSFDREFDLILSTSWSPTDYAALSLLLARTQSPLFIQPCNHGEADKLRMLHPRIQVLDSLPCDWIDPAFYPPSNPSQRDIDFLMVANWGEFKRHWDFFAALTRLPRELRVVLVGQKEAGRDADFIRRLATQIGVPQDLEIHQSLGIAQVTALQSRAKVSLIFSRREGCCVASVESLFAGCALGMRADAHVGPLRYIHEQTGLRLRPGHLAEDLARLLDLSKNLEPAHWAASNISCQQTYLKVNQALQASATTRKLPWTTDLCAPHWRPYPAYIHQEDAVRMSDPLHQLSERFPALFPIQ